MKNDATWITPVLGLVAACLVGNGCATSKQARSVTPEKGEASVLGDDGALLQEGKDGQPLLIYESSSANWSGYSKVIIMPVKFAKPEGASANDLQDLQTLTDSMQAALVRELGQILEIVTEPGPGTLRVETSLYDAQKKKTAGNLISGVLPVGALVNGIVVAARGKSLFVGELSEEMKITEAMSGKLIAEAVDRRVGRKYQSAEFTTWGEAHDAIEYWAKSAHSAICKRKGMTECPRG
jgi:Protein of unknown function (DUF3313)